tara:strand:+ start:448 stop:945 length:498 start_codon:yes stop_codon:yes gene_type:complete
MNLRRHAENLAPEAFGAVGMRTTTALKIRNPCNVASVDAMPTWTTVLKRIFIAHAAPVEPRFQRKPRADEGGDATRTHRAGIKPTNAPVVWPVSAPERLEMSGDPTSVNGALIVKSNAVVAGPRVAKIAPRDRPCARKQKTPPSAPVGAGGRPHQPPHPKAKAPS